MAQQVDSKIVEMKFDNKQFESGVKTSLTSLAKLKSSLNLEGAAKGFKDIDEAANKVSLEGIASGIEKLKDRFSILGTAGARVVENITDSLMKLASKAASYVKDAIVTGGLKRAQNIENAHFQLQALLKDEEQVQAVMDNAMASVDGTAYAYDEAAKAASQFAASGLKAGEDMERALRGITGVAAMTNSQYSEISTIFTTVAGNGRLMGDQLLQLGTRGMNAAATLADYLREVEGMTDITESDVREMVSASQISFDLFVRSMDWAFGESAFRANETFSGALANMRSALARIGAGFFSPLIEQNSDLVLLINTLREKFNEVKAVLVFDEQKSAISGLAKETGLTTEALGEMFASIKTNGKVSAENLKTLSDKGIDATQSLTDYINGVTDGSIRATYATQTAVKDLTGGMEVSRDQVSKFVEEGSINLNMFTSAMEKAYGDLEPMSKKFTDYVLDMAQSVSDYLKKLDVGKIMEGLVNIFEAGLNIVTAFIRPLTSLGKAFANVFLNLKSDGLLTFTKNLKKATSQMGLSKKGSKDLQDAFEGVFNVVKLLMDAFFGLFGAIEPMDEPIESLSDLIAAFAGNLGRGLTAVTEWVRESDLLSSIYDKIRAAVQSAINAVTDFIPKIGEFIASVKDSDLARSAIGSISLAFQSLYETGGTYLEKVIEKVKSLKDSMMEAFPEKAKSVFESIIGVFAGIKDAVTSIDFTSPSEMIKSFTETIKGLFGVFQSNEGLTTFSTNAGLFSSRVSEAFSFESVVGHITTFRNVMDSFITWIKNTFVPSFDNISLGGLTAVIGGGGLIFSIFKIVKEFNKIGTTISPLATLRDSINMTLGSVRETLKAYQKDLKADAMEKIAKAIAILAASLTLLSFADTKGVLVAAIALATAGSALAVAAGYFQKMNKKGTEIGTVLNNLAQGVKWKAIGSALKDMGTTIAILVGSIAVIAAAYKADGDSMSKAVDLVGSIAGIMAILIVTMSLLGDKLTEGMASLSKAGSGVLKMGAALLLIVTSVKSIMKMEISEDWVKKLAVVGGAMLALADLALMMAIAGKIAGKDSGSVGGSLIAAAGSIYLVVQALKGLFKLKLTKDWEKKLIILGGIFVGLNAMILVIGAASKLAENKLKATGTILSMAVLIGSIVAALGVLSLFPGERLFKGAIALGGTLIASAVALAGAGAIGGKESWKTVLAMAIQIGVIVASLGILSMLSAEDLLKGAIALGSILLTLAVDFNQVANVTDKLAFASIVAMAVNIGVITLALSVLSGQPWENLLAASVSLSAVLLSIAGAFSIISSSSVDLPSIVTFLSGAIGVAIMGLALTPLAGQPWEGILAAGVSLSAVLLSIAGAFKIMSTSPLDIGALVNFAAGVVGVGVIALILYALSSQPWENLLGAATSISLTLVAIAVAMAICGLVGTLSVTAIAGIATLDLFIANLAAVLLALGNLGEDAEAFLNKGGEVLKSLGKYLGEFVGSIFGGILEGITDSLPAVGENLSNFAEKMQGFFEIMGNVEPEVLSGTLTLAEAILALSAASFLNGLSKLAGNLLGMQTMEEMADDLEALGDGVERFYQATKDIDPEVVTAAASCASVLAAFYDELPDMGGLYQKIFGQPMKLSEFAAELDEFGPALVEFCETVDGNVSESVVTTSVNAAKILASFYDELPDMGGLYQKIFGQPMKFKEFASEILSFGTSMALYSSIVDGKIDEDAVTNSVNAAKVLASLYDELPDMGGLAGMIFGDKKKLSEFGEELVPFATAMLSYSTIISGVNSDIITQTANAAGALVSLENELGGEEGLISLFSRQEGLDDFGDKLKKFGQGLLSYYESVKTIDTVKLVTVITQVQKLIEIAKSVVGLDTSGLTTFASDLKTMGNNGITEFLSAFNEALDRITLTVQAFVGYVLLAFTSQLELFRESGSTSADYWLFGISARSKEAQSTGKAMANEFISAIKNRYESMRLTGNTSANRYLSGIKEKYESATVTGTSIANKVKNAIVLMNVDFYSTGMTSAKKIVEGFETLLSHSNEKSFYKVGQNAGQGFIDGVLSKSAAAASAGRTLATSMTNAASSTLQSHSPSRVMAQLGEYAGIGFINGLMYCVSTASMAGEELAGAAVDGLQFVIQDLSDVFDENGPVIRPTVDLTDVENSVSYINSLFNESIQTLAWTANEAASLIPVKPIVSEKIGETSEQSNSPKNQYTFIQNNNSPKALSRIDLYRQTKNQFAQFKKVVDQL